MKVFTAVAIVLLLATIGFFSCSTPEKELPAPGEINKDSVLKTEKEDEYVPWKNAKKLIEEGQSWSANYSPDGSLVRLASSARSQDGQAEIYEIHLETSDVQRLTYLSSLTEEAQFMEKDQLLYRSTTDEIKERPELFKAYEESPEAKASLPHLGELPDSELYLRPGRTSKVIRLTKSPGFDGFYSLHPQGKKLLHSRSEAGQLDIYLTDTQSLETKALITGPYHDSFPLFSEDGSKIYWLEVHSEGPKSLFYRANEEAEEKELIATFEGVAAYPSLHPTKDLMLFSGRVKNSELFSIYLLDLKEACFRELFSSRASLFHPDIAPNGEQLLLTVSRDGRKTAYQINLDEKELACH